MLKLNKLLLLLFIAALLSSCFAKTKLTETWSDPKYKGPQFKKILVIGLFKEDVHRRTFEATFANRVDKDIAEAIPGYKLMRKPEDCDTKEEVVAAVEKINADAVLISHYKGSDLRIDNETEYISFEARLLDYRDRYDDIGYGPGYGRYGRYGGYGDYYGTVYEAVLRPGGEVADTFVSLETRLYSVKTGNVVWAGISQSKNPKTAKMVNEDLVGLVIKDMQKSNLLK